MLKGVGYNFVDTSGKLWFGRGSNLSDNSKVEIKMPKKSPKIPPSSFEQSSLGTMNIADF